MIHLGKTNYKNSILNLASSIMKNYNLKSEYEPHALVDFILSKKYKHVAVVLLDGLGIKVIDDNLGNGSILKTHQIMTLNSVYPPTTVAATTSITSGIAPIESGWLGWHLYLNDTDPSINLFTNTVNKTGETFTSFNVSDVIPQNDYLSSLKKTKCYTIYPSFREDGVETFKEAIDSLEKICKLDETNFTYLYWDNPDYLMHEYGTTSQVVRTYLMDMENQIERLSKNLPNDTVVFITADHGMIDVEPVEIDKNTTLMSYLKKDFSGEGRFAQFYVLDEYKSEFVNLFNSLYGDDFKLYSKQEFLDSKLAGLYTPNSIVEYALGDYIAIGISNKFFTKTLAETDMLFKAHHAGLTKEEMEVPVILLKRKDEPKEEQ